MEGKKLIFLFIPFLIFAVSCGSGGKPAEDSQLTGPVKTEVSQERYDSTKDEVQKFIAELNRVIRRKDYEAWKNALSPEYFNELSSPENLQSISEQPVIKMQGFTLKSAEDYFRHVVVPSRANTRVDDSVDDIEFISANRVKAYTIKVNAAGEERRVRLYDLEKTGNTWKIIS